MTRKGNQTVASLAYQKRHAKRIVLANQANLFQKEEKMNANNNTNPPARKISTLAFALICIGLVAAFIVAIVVINARIKSSIPAALPAATSTPIAKTASAVATDVPAIASAATQASTAVPTTVPTDAPTVVPTTGPVSMTIVINGQGTNSPMIWNQPLSAGQMVGALGTIYYTQSGKNGVQTITGSIKADQALVVDAFRLDYNGKSYTDGVILVIPGPVENLVPLTITNGAIQTIGKDDLQNLLDVNIWVKFCRGDKNKSGTAWSYQKWALTTTILPEGFTFKGLDVCFTNATDDIYTNNPPQN